MLNAFKLANILRSTPFIVFRPSASVGTSMILVIEKKYQTYVTGLSLITGMRFDALIRVVIVDKWCCQCLFHRDRGCIDQTKAKVLSFDILF